jgi:hypothetical protein
METDDLLVATQLLENDALFPQNSLANPGGQLAPDVLHRRIADRVAYLLAEDFSQLMASLYQIDVAEELVAEAFRLPTREAIVDQLATYIIARELHKAQTRAERRFS